MELETSVLNGAIKTYLLRPREAMQYDIHVFLTRSLKRITRQLDVERNVAGPGIGVKFQLSLKTQMKRYVYEDEIETVKLIDPYFNSNNRIYEDSSHVQHACTEVVNAFESFIMHGSGWMLNFILFLRVQVFQYKLYSGGHGEHKLPKKLIATKSCWNVTCTDQECFIYCCLVVAHRLERKRRNVALLKFYRRDLNLDRVHFPMTVKQIQVFETDNPQFSINVLSYNNGSPIPVYCTTNRSRHCHTINLLLINNHFIIINSLSRLLKQQCPRGKKSFHFCHYCLCRFTSKKQLLQHSELCRKKLQKMDTHYKYDSIQFRNYRNMFRIPFVIYYDIECIIRNGAHIPISICCFRKCSNDLYTKPPIVFTSSECINQFLDHLQREECEITNLLDVVNAPMQCDERDRERIKTCTHCELCGKEFDEHNKRYRDHDHMQTQGGSNLRFVLCNRCNLTYGKTNPIIPVVCHNASHYDLHFIISHLPTHRRVSVLAKTTERYLSLSLGSSLVFLDSLNFISGSLDNLTRDLVSKPDNNLDRYLEYITTNTSKKNLLKRKGIFPYDWLDDEEKLKARAIPDISKFYNALRAEHISEDDYHHACCVWAKFECHTMRDYLELYLVLDVLLLAAIFEMYRRETYSHMTLDPVHYVSSPSLCFDAMLKITNIQLETLPSVDSYLWVNKCIRGGVSGTSVRYARANNPRVEGYNPQRDFSYIVGFDLNALYSYCMCLPLPYKSFFFLTDSEITNFDINSVSLESDIGYFLEVDLHYPPELHDLHNQFPLAPEKVAIEPHQWSDFMQNECDTLGMKQVSCGSKLMATLCDKTHYILHYHVLQLYLRLGLKLTKIHRIMSFKQKAFMKSYINLNIEKRKLASSSFDVALYKLYNNSVFGKCMYNVFKQSNYKLVQQVSSFRRLAGKPTFQSCQVINDHLVGVQMKPNTIHCNKPIYIGAAILDFAKHHMYSFYYDYLLKHYSHTDVDMLYTDTDSFYLCIRNQPQFYKDILQHERYFDRSNYHSSHFLFSNKRKRDLGLMKDVHANDVISEVVCLRPKMYAVKTVRHEEDIRAKGLQKSALRKVNVDTFKMCLRSIRHTRHHFVSIRSFKHRVVSHSSSKIGLSPFDDKRYYLSCGIHSYAYGHYKIDHQLQKCSCGGIT